MKFRFIRLGTVTALLIWAGFWWRSHYTQAGAYAHATWQALRNEQATAVISVAALAVFLVWLLAPLARGRRP